MRKEALLIISVFAAITAISQAGTLDPNFGSEGIVRSNLFIGRGPATARKTFVQPDSTLLVVMQEDNQVITKHFFSDGSFDPEYNQYEYSSTLAYGDAAQDSIGRIVLAGTQDKDFTVTYQGGEQNYKMGFPDSSIATAIAIQRDGKILVAGYTYIKGIAHFAIARCFPDGRLDSTFSDDGRQVTSNGNNGTFATCIALQTDGKIVVGGYAGGYLAHRDFSLVRYNTNGSRDLTFSGDGKQLTSVGAYDDIANAVAIQPDGKILLSGRTQLVTALAGEYAMATVRYNINGTLDATFNSSGIVVTAIGSSAEAVAIVVQDNTKIVVAGRAADFILLRYNNDGSPDASIGNSGVQYIDFENGADQLSSAVLADGKILLTGWTDPTRGKMREIALARYTADVKPDVRFSSDGKVSQYFSTSSTTIRSTVVQADGKLVVGGAATDYDYPEYTMLVMARYNPDGSFDTSFGIKGQINTELEGFGGGANAMALQGDGKIIVGSSTYNNDNDFVLMRYTTDGDIDYTFGNNGISYIDFASEMSGYSDDNIAAIAIQPDGKIVAVGSAQFDTEEGTIGHMAIARCNSDGSLDASFGEKGKKLIGIMGVFDERADAVAIQSNSKIVMAGAATSEVTLRGVFTVIRLNTDGTLDQSFSRDGKLITGFGPTINNVFVNTVCIQPDTKIIVGGSSSGYFTLVRYFANGNLDLSFSGDGKQTSNLGGNSAINKILIQSDGKILAAGKGKERFALARYRENGNLDSTFGTNGKQTTIIERYQNEIRGIAIYGDRLYAAGFGVTYVGVGVIAAYRLNESSPVTKVIKAVPEDQSGELIVRIFPNPAMQNFTIQTISKSSVPLSVRVIDAAGHLVDAFNGLASNGRLQLGAKYTPGVYYAEILQEDRKVTIKLVKSK